MRIINLDEKLALMGVAERAVNDKKNKDYDGFFSDYDDCGINWSFVESDLFLSPEAEALRAEGIVDSELESWLWDEFVKEYREDAYVRELVSINFYTKISVRIKTKEIK